MERARKVVAAIAATALVGGLGWASSPSVLSSAPAGRGAPGVVPGTAVTQPLDQSNSRSLAAPAAVEAPAAPGDAAIAPPPVTFDATPPPPPPPPQELLASAPPPALADAGVWAVIVGIDDYPGHAADLRSAVNDANDMDEALARLGVPPERRLVLHDTEATANVIGRAADWLVARAGPDSTAVFFYAGHVRKTAAGNEAIVAADGKLLTDGDLAARLAPLAARTWIVMASCFGGGFTEALAPGRLLTAAADANSLAYENSGFGRSYLVEYMVRRGLIQGNAGATAQEAYAYADGALRREYPNRVPFQLDRAGEPIELSMPVPVAGLPVTDEPSSPSPTPMSSPAEQQPSQPSQPPRRHEAAPPSEDDGECAGLQLGVVTCGG